MVQGKRPQIRIWHGPLILLIAITSYVVHEFAHWATGELMGYDLYVGINKAGLARDEYSQEWHAQLVSIAGPVVTILIAIIALGLIYRYKMIHLFLAAEKLDLNWKAWVICFVFSSIAITLVVFAEPHLPLINPYSE